MFSKGADNVYRCSLLAGLPWVVHGFGTRDSVDWPGEYIRVNQIHSDIIVCADDKSGSVGKADGLVLTSAGHLIGVRTADCVPLLMVDPQSRTVAAVHAGWRGTAAGIAPKAVRHLEQMGSRARELLVAIGPCIGECCYEVGPELEEHFRPIFPDATDFTRINLPEANRRQLISAGVVPDNIDVCGLCTQCGGEFHSYRREREQSGRMVSAIGIVNGPTQMLTR